MANKHKNSYTAYLKIECETDIQITATSLEEALERAKALSLDDVIDLPGGFIDGAGLTVRGVLANG